MPHLVDDLAQVSAVAISAVVVTKFYIWHSPGDVNYPPVYFVYHAGIQVNISTSMPVATAIQQLLHSTLKEPLSALLTDVNCSTAALDQQGGKAVLLLRVYACAIRIHALCAALNPHVAALPGQQLSVQVPGVATHAAMGGIGQCTTGHIGGYFDALGVPQAVGQYDSQLQTSAGGDSKAQQHGLPADETELHLQLPGLLQLASVVLQHQQPAEQNIHAAVLTESRPKPSKKHKRMLSKGTCADVQKGCGAPGTMMQTGDSSAVGVRVPCSLVLVVSWCCMQRLQLLHQQLLQLTYTCAVQGNAEHQHEDDQYDQHTTKESQGATLNGQNPNGGCVQSPTAAAASVQEPGSRGLPDNHTGTGQQGLQAAIREEMQQLTEHLLQPLHALVMSSRCCDTTSTTLQPPERKLPSQRLAGSSASYTSPSATEAHTAVSLDWLPSHDAWKGTVAGLDCAGLLQAMVSLLGSTMHVWTPHATAHSLGLYLQTLMAAVACPHSHTAAVDLEASRHAAEPMAGTAADSTPCAANNQPTHATALASLAATANFCFRQDVFQLASVYGCWCRAMSSHIYARLAQAVAVIDKAAAAAVQQATPSTSTTSNGLLMTAGKNRKRHKDSRLAHEQPVSKASNKASGPSAATYQLSLDGVSSNDPHGLLEVLQSMLIPFDDPTDKATQDWVSKWAHQHVKRQLAAAAATPPAIQQHLAEMQQAVLAFNDVQNLLVVWQQCPLQLLSRPHKQHSTLIIAGILCFLLQLHLVLRPVVSQQSAVPADQHGQAWHLQQLLSSCIGLALQLLAQLHELHHLTTAASIGNKQRLRIMSWLLLCAKAADSSGHVLGDASSFDGQAGQQHMTPHSMVCDAVAQLLQGLLTIQPAVKHDVRLTSSSAHQDLLARAADVASAELAAVISGMADASTHQPSTAGSANKSAKRKKGLALKSECTEAAVTAEAVLMAYSTSTLHQWSDATASRALQQLPSPQAQATPPATASNQHAADKYVADRHDPGHLLGCLQPQQAVSAVHQQSVAFISLLCRRLMSGWSQSSRSTGSTPVNNDAPDSRLQLDAVCRLFAAVASVLQWQVEPTSQPPVVDDQTHTASVAEVNSVGSQKLSSPAIAPTLEEVQQLLTAAVQLLLSMPRQQHLHPMPQIFEGCVAPCWDAVAAGCALKLLSFVHAASLLLVCDKDCAQDQHDDIITTYLKLLQQLAPPTVCAALPPAYFNLKDVTASLSLQHRNHAAIVPSIRQYSADAHHADDFAALLHAGVLIGLCDVVVASQRSQLLHMYKSVGTWVQYGGQEHSMHAVLQVM